LVLEDQVGWAPLAKMLRFHFSSGSEVDISAVTRSSGWKYGRSGSGSNDEGQQRANARQSTALVEGALELERTRCADLEAAGGPLGCSGRR